MAAPYAPTIQVEAAFGYGPLEASPAWTDITAYVQSITSRRGRGSEFEQFTAGSMTVTLKDTARVFDPLNTAGAYYGSLVPNVPLRFSATYGGTEYPRAYGFVDGWDINLDPSNNVAYVTVAATDGFKILAQKKLPDAYLDLLDTLDPIWFRCGALNGLSFTDTTSTHNILTAVADVTIVDGLALRSDGAVRFPAYVPPTLGAAVREASIGAQFPTEVFAGTAYSVALRFKSGPMVATGNSRFLFTANGAGTCYVDAAIQADGLLVARIGEGGDSLTATTPTRVDDGLDHHVVVVRTGTTMNLYLDGVLVGTDTDAAVGAATTFDPMYFGYIVPNNENYPSWDLDDLMFFPGDALDATEVGDLDELQDDYYGGTVPTGERIGDILDLVGWPAGLRDIDVGEVLVGPTDIAGDGALAYLQLVAASEQGRLFIGQDGYVVYQDGLAIAADSATAATFTDDGTDSKYLAGSLRFTIDDRNIYNDAQVTRDGGVMQTASDATSIAAYGPRTWSVSSLPLSSDGSARDLAERKVARYKDPQVRAESWTVNPQVSPTTWGTILGLEIGDHVELEVRPVNTGTRETIQLDLEQITETITPAKYELTLFGSPRDPNIGSYFEWGGADGSVTGWGAGVWR
jgi:hypothetical protein